MMSAGGATHIRANHSVRAMRAMALALFPSMEWRHHGIGVLQGYISEGGVSEVRLHVWARELLKPGIDASGDIHDHRFDMVSHVLAGRVGHTEIHAEHAIDGEWRMLALTHARAAKATGYHGPTQKIVGSYSVNAHDYVIEAGNSYTFPRGVFHRSPLQDDVAVTCVEKHNQTDERARILYPFGKPPVMAFGHAMDWAIVGPVLERAKEALVRHV